MKTTDKPSERIPGNLRLIMLKISQFMGIKAMTIEFPENENVVVLGDMNTMGYDGGVNEDFGEDGTLEHLEFRSDVNSSNDFCLK